ncbi:MAG: hypothetical protein AAFR76_01550 [Planctomycetota bacterium]
MTWVDQLRTWPLADLAGRFGGEVRGQGNRCQLRPCTACGAMERSDQDKRWPVQINGAQWYCYACQTGGAAIEYAAYAVCGRVLPAGDPGWQQLRQTLFGEGSTPPPKAKPPKPLSPPPRPPQIEVRDLWHACRPVTDDYQVARWLRGRALDPETVARLDLARALPVGRRCPRWAGSRGRSWAESGHRLLLRVCDHTGHTMALRARAVVPIEKGQQKTLAARAGPRSSTGLVYADAPARRMLLAHGQGPPVNLIIAEGGPDWLTWACRELAWATLGVFSGSWATAIAGRIPDGSTVVIRTHADAAGQKYADRIVRSLALRRDLKLFRRCVPANPEPAEGAA